MSAQQENREYVGTLRERALDEEGFIELSLKGKVRGDAVPWRRILVRPVLVKGKRHLQFSYFSETQDITKNYRGEEAARKLDEALAIPFSSVNLRHTAGDLRVQLTKKGEPVLHKQEPSPSASVPSLAHDHQKALPLPPNRPDRFLQVVGIQNSDGSVRPHMQAKLSQINEFLKLLDHTGVTENVGESPLQIVDLGCGSAYLTFATYHYLNNVRGIPARLTGVDVNEALIRKNEAHRDQLGYTDLSFLRSPITEYSPPAAPDIVLALHACNTATDDALAQSVRWGARAVLSVPCCHHYLNERIRSDVLAPMLRHGILKERTADIVTDAFRALTMRIMGYRTDVIEFISPEHTSRNLMIRAVKGRDQGEEALVREYNAMKDFWKVTPYMEGLLGDELRRYTESTAPSTSG